MESEEREILVLEARVGFKPRRLLMLIGQDAADEFGRAVLLLLIEAGQMGESRRRDSVDRLQRFQLANHSGNETLPNGADAQMGRFRMHVGSVSLRPFESLSQFFFHRLEILRDEKIGQPGSEQILADHSVVAEIGNEARPSRKIFSICGNETGKVLHLGKHDGRSIDRLSNFPIFPDCVVPKCTERSKECKRSNHHKCDDEEEEALILTKELEHEMSPLEKSNTISDS